MLRSATIKNQLCCIGWQLSLDRLVINILQMTNGYLAVFDQIAGVHVPPAAR